MSKFAMNNDDLLRRCIIKRLYFGTMIVFDLDDTLYQEADYVKSGIAAVCRALDDRGVLSFSEAKAIIDNAGSTAQGFDLIVDAAHRKFGDNTLDIRQILDMYRTHIPDISLDESTLEVLKRLRDSGEPVGLITDGRSIGQRAKIKALGLEEFFAPEDILISEETGFDKHCPQPFRRMMEQHPQEHRFVYVGDNPRKDFIWPNQLGWITIMLRDVDGRNIHKQVVPGVTDSGDLQIVCENGDSHDPQTVCENGDSLESGKKYAAQLEITSLAQLLEMLHNEYYVK